MSASGQALAKIAPMTAPGVPATPPIPTSPTGPALFGVGVLLCATIALGAWSFFAPLSSGAVAVGQVVVDSNRKAVQHLEGGIVAELLVEEGDLVERGQLLLRLDQTSASVTEDVIRGQLQSTRALEARLIAERDGLATIPFADELLTDAAADTQELVRGQERIFTARSTALDGQIEIFQQRIGQLRRQIEGLDAQVISKAQQIALIEDELDGLRELFDQGYTSRTRILALEREAARLDGERGQHEAEIARAEVAVGEARLQVLQIRNSFIEEVVAELREVQTQLFDLRDRLRGASDVVDRTEILSPQRGIVIGLQVFTEGGVVPPGRTIMEIVPIDERLVVEARLEPTDIDVVSIGLEAEVRFSSLSQRGVPIVLGRVTRVGADALADQQGIPYYAVRVEVGPDELARLEGETLIPGMPAEVIVKAGEQTVVEYLVRPLTDVLVYAFREQ
jgi:HlyD family type I secretion membrane fusion protein